MPTLTQHVCFACRKVFKKPFYGFVGDREFERHQPPYECPECHAPMVHMGYKFRAPRCSNVKEWTRIEDGVKFGTPWEKPTVRKKSKIERKISPALKKALGFRSR